MKLARFCSLKSSTIGKLYYKSCRFEKKKSTEKTLQKPEIFFAVSFFIKVDKMSLDLEFFLERNHELFKRVLFSRPYIKIPTFHAFVIN